MRTIPKSILLTLAALYVLVQSAHSQNNPPIISADFPDTVITKQGVSNPDSIFALPLADFGSDPDGDLLTWSIATDDSIIAFFDADQETLFVHSQDRWYGRGSFVVKLSDGNGGEDEKSIQLIAFKQDGTLERFDGSKTEYYIPWHPQLDFNRISSVEQFLIEEGYQEEALDRSIHWSRWKKIKHMRDVEFLGGWLNETNLPGWTWESQKMLIDYTFDELKWNNVDHIRIINQFFGTDVNSNEVFRWYDWTAFNADYPTALTIRDEELIYIINQAHNKGMEISFIPKWGDFNFPRNNIAPTNWEAWFDSYGNLVQDYALIAYRTGVDIFHPGGSLINLSGTISDEDWGNLFRSKVTKPSRAIYPGPLAYLDGSPGFGKPLPEFGKIKIWNDFDIAGFGGTSVTNWMFDNLPLFKIENPSVQDLVEFFTWHKQNVLPEFQKVSKRPIIFFENGISSQDSVYIRFWDYVGGVLRTAPNMINQKNYYEAQFQVYKNDPDVFGLGCYGYEFFYASGGVKNTHITPRGKPAEDVMRYYYGNGDTKSRIINIDGNFDDWKPEYQRATDALGDSKTSAYDFKAVYGIRDDMYLYLMFEFDGGLRNVQQKDLIGLNFDLNGDNTAEYPFGVIKNDPNWQGVMNNDMTFSEYRCVVLSEPDSTLSRFEVKIPLRVFHYSTSISIMNIGVGDLQANESYDHIQGAFEIPTYAPTNVQKTKAESSTESFIFFQNHPNPFNSSTKVRYDLRQDCNVKIEIFNILGQNVATLLDKNQTAGSYKITWDGTDKSGSPVNSGMYFIKMKTEDFEQVKKCLLIK